MGILLKRLYERDAKLALVRDKQTGQPSVVGVKVVRTGEPGSVQHFTPEYIATGAAQGWLSMARGMLTIHSDGGQDVHYQIVRAPGGYCCHCDEPLPIVGAGQINTEAQEHVKAHGKPSPDPQNPAGYRADAFYATILRSGKTDTLTPAQGAKMDRQIREALVEKIEKKYGAVAVRRVARSTKKGS